MPKRRFWILTVLITVCLSVGCERKPDPSTLPQGSIDSGPAALPTPAPDVPLVAKVNGEGITEQEFNDLFEMTLKSREDEPTPSERFEIRLNVLNSLIMAKILKQKALAADLAVSSASVEIALAQVRLNFHNNEQELLGSLADRGFTLEQFKKTLENEIRVRVFEDMIMNEYEVPVTEEDLKDWYAEHLDSYLTPEKLKVSHILAAVAENAAENEVQAAYDKAVQLRERIVSGGADFADTAEKYSEDPTSAERGGYLGEMIRGQMVQSFEEAAFALPMGGVSEPVRTYKGWHLVKLIHRTPAQPIDFDKAVQLGVLEKDYIANRRAVYFSDWLAAQRQETEVEILDKYIIKVR